MCFRRSETKVEGKVNDEAGPEGGEGVGTFTRQR